MYLDLCFHQDDIVEEKIPQKGVEVMSGKGLDAGLPQNDICSLHPSVSDHIMLESLFCVR